MKDKALDNRAKINHIKNALDLGWITYDQAKEMAEPIIAEINEKAKEIAKKYGVKPGLVNFNSLMR